jgi:serine/threonine protein kinase
MNVFDLTGQIVGSYKIGDLIGKGAMGVVYHATHENMPREFAVKVLPPELQSEEEYFKRFRREASTAAALQHPHIVPVYDYGTHEIGKLDISYIVMQLLLGGTLADRLKPPSEGGHSYPTLAEIIRIAHDLASALDYAHSKGVVHRDIKPANVMFNEEKSAVIVDFGVAKLQDATRYTQSNATLGTPAYMAPEQWTATTEVLPATDQYALAVMVYEMLSGQFPFKATTSFQFAYKHLHEMPTSILEFRPDLPTKLDDVLTRALEKEPHKRYATVKEFAQELEASTENILNSDFTVPSSTTAQGTPPKTPIVKRDEAPSLPPISERSKTYDILPTPFAWLKIPTGQVTLEMGGYITGMSETFNVPTFWMAKFPITNGQFAKFVEADGYRQKKWWTETGWGLKEKENWAAPRCWLDSQWNGKDYPVIGVTWYEALTFCRWLSEATGEKIMLPTEQQWQRAAQGDDERSFPWGNDWDPERCNNSVGKDWRQNTTTPVDRYERIGDSPYHIVDMSGNVWEWCLTQFETGSNDLQSTHNRVMRGGSWGNYVTGVLRVNHRCGYEPHAWNVFRGFRIARLV